MGTIKGKYDVASKSSLAYAKPYTATIDSLKSPAGYQPPKLLQFDGKENPNQHIAHFVKTCNNAEAYGDYFVKQFVCSLKENAFDWYTDLEVGSIDSWEQLEHEFLNRFYSTRRTVGMVELTNTQLATRAYGMELSMPSSGNQWPPIYEPLKVKDKQKIKKVGKFFSKSESKESMNVIASPLKVTTKEMQPKEYPFLDFDVIAIFEELLELKLIELPKMKRLDEVGRTNDPNYCKYHRLIGHPMEKCFIFKEKVMDLATEGKILPEDEKESSNQVYVTFGSLDPIVLCNFVELP
ncbi:uncharacterized protein [Nicotiana sylvestris]|uniref:uncharacterized protein n=1 Tax=Nicotiana sylvestris TaxID=4096 RepID=UPI00388C7EBC